MALKYHDDPQEALIANTNLGGDNAGRGAVLDTVKDIRRRFPG